MVDMKSALDKVKEVHQQAKDAGRDSVQEAMDNALQELQGLKPLLARAGFSLGNITIALGLPPNIVVAIIHDREVASGLEELAAATNLTNIQSLIVKSLKSAYSFTGMFQKYGYVIGQLSVEVGLIPKVTIVLTSASK
jgi:hypothetical protein